MLSQLLSRTVRCPIQDLSQVGESRRVGQDLAQRLAFDETQAGKLAIVITELGNNIIKHGAADGELLLRTLQHNGETIGLEVLAIDNGRGMDNVNRNMVDGYSTAGTSGTGLGAVRRLADDFTIYSTPGKGTAVLARVRASGRHRTAGDGYRLGAVCVEKPGEPISGDGWCVVPRAGVLLAMVADGLGHGVSAAEAANEAIRVLSESALQQPAQLVDVIHAALQKTRGAAVAVAAVNTAKGTVHYAGLGNIAGVILGANGERRSLISQNGTAGVEARRIQEYTYPWQRGAVLIMHSDGLKQWNIDAYAGALQHDPAVIAGLLYRDFRRGTDDVTVLALVERE